MSKSKVHPLALLTGVLFGLLAATVAWLYVSGFFYLALSKMNPLNTTYATWVSYWIHYGQIEAVRGKLISSALIAGAICFLGPLLVWAAAKNKKRELHGSARFASDAEIRESGLYADKGVLVGKHKGRFLVFDSQQFVLLAAPTRAGKGVGVVIPNLLTYPDSVVVLDVKQENYDITSGFRAKHGQEVYLFNPFAEDMRTHRYNPLGYISDNPHFRIGDILAIGYAFWSGEGKDPFFDDQARNLFLGLCLYLCETPELPRTMGELLRQSSGKGRPIKDYLQSLIDERNYEEVEQEEDVIDDKTGMPVFDPKTGEIKRQAVMVKVPREWDGEGLPPLSPECVDALNRFTSTSDNTLASILASFNAPLVIWSNPIVDAATAANDFDLRDVRKRRMTIYIGITPDHLAEAGLLVNVLFSQLVNLNTKELPQKNPELKHQCLLLMDEFTAIGKVKIIAKAVSYMAGYNLRLLPIIQSVSQLASVYGHEDSRTFITNHALQIYYAPREQKDANEYSEMLGYQTVKAVSKGEQLGARHGRSKNESDQKRALLLPQELKEIGQDKEIIALENTKPIFCDKIRYYQDPVLMQRVMPAPDVPLLDLDLHLAMVQQRMREVTDADVAGGVDLNKLAIDLSSVDPLDGEYEASPEEVQGFVSQMFGAFGFSADVDAAEDPDQADEQASVEDFEDEELDGYAEPFIDGSVDDNDDALPDVEPGEVEPANTGDSGDIALETADPDIPDMAAFLGAMAPADDDSPPADGLLDLSVLDDDEGVRK